MTVASALYSKQSAVQEGHVYVVDHMGPLELFA